LIVIPEAEFAEITRSEVVLILKPAQSRTTLFDMAVKPIAKEGQFMSELSIVSAVSVVLQGGVTAYILVAFRNIRTPAKKVDFKYVNF
jgi:hypothetical protein